MRLSRIRIGFSQRVVKDSRRDSRAVRSRIPPSAFVLGGVSLCGAVAAAWFWPEAWDDFSALAKLPQTRAVLLRVQELDPEYKEGDVEHFLAVLNTIRPPALGGDFDEGLKHYERAIEVSDGRNLAVKVNFAKYYARTLYDRELHDRLLNEVLAADPVQTGFTLFNTLAQDEAQALLDSADDYF